MRTIRIGLAGGGPLAVELGRLVRENADTYGRRDDLAFEIAAGGAAAAPGVEVLVEALDDPEAAWAAARGGLERGIPVAVSSRALVAVHGAELARLAAEHGTACGTAAAVAGGLPAAGALLRALEADRFDSLLGVVSGPANLVLTRMADENLAFDAAWEQVRAACPAPPGDPGRCLEGRDAAETLAVLAALAFGVEIPPSEIHAEGIARITPRDLRLVAGFDYVLKPLALARRTSHGLELRVHPALVSRRHPLAAVRDDANAVLCTGRAVGDVMLQGRSGGVAAVAGALLADAVRLVRLGGPDPRRWCWQDLEHVPIGDVVTGYYMFFPVLDRPGVIGRIASTLGSYGINIESAHAQLTEPSAVGGLVQILSHRARERDVRAALQAVRDLPVLTGEPWFYRIEG